MYFRPDTMCVVQTRGTSGGDRILPNYHQYNHDSSLYMADWLTSRSVFPLKSQPGTQGRKLVGVVLEDPEWAKRAVAP